MQLYTRDMLSIRQSYGRRNRQFVGFFLHFVAFSVANSSVTLPDPLTSLWLLALFGHFIWLMIYSRNERRYRRALGEKTVVVPVYNSRNDESYEYEVEKAKRNAGYIHAADGSVLEVIEDEKAALPNQKRKRTDDYNL